MCLFEICVRGEGALLNSPKKKLFWLKVKEYADKLREFRLNSRQISIKVPTACFQQFLQGIQYKMFSQRKILLKSFNSV